MTNKQEHIILTELARILRDEYKKSVKGLGLYLNNTVIDPEPCRIIAEVLREHHNKEYGNCWGYDSPAIEFLEKVNKK